MGYLSGQKSKCACKKWAKGAGFVSENAASLPEVAQFFPGPRSVPIREKVHFVEGVFSCTHEERSAIFEDTGEISLSRLISIGNIQDGRMVWLACRPVQQSNGCLFLMPYKDPELLLKPKRRCQKKLRSMKTLRILAPKSRDVQDV